MVAPAGASAPGTGESWSLTQSHAGRMEHPGAAGGSCGGRAEPPATAGAGWYLR